MTFKPAVLSVYACSEDGYKSILHIVNIVIISLEWTVPVS
jgi:hypothetical protein